VPPNRAATKCLARHAGHRGADTKALASLVAKARVSVPFIRVAGRGSRGRGPHSVGRGGNSAHVFVLGGCTHLGFRENAGPFAGARATGSLEGARRVRDHDPSCRARTPSAHGNSNRERACTRHRGARSGTSRGSAALSSAPDLGSIGSVRCGACSSEPRWHRLVVRGRAFPEGRVRRRASRRRESVSLRRALRGATTRSSCPHVVRVANVDRPPPEAEKRARCIVWVESPGDETGARERASSLGRGHGAQALVSSPGAKGSAVLRASMILIT